MYSIPGHDLCPGCWERLQDSIVGGGTVGKFRMSESQLKSVGVKVATPKTSTPTVLASQLLAYSRSKGWPDPTPEHVFHPERKWRFDFAYPTKLVAIEYEGLTGGSGGRHQRLAGFAEDARKYTEAAILGWVVIRITAQTVNELWAWLDRAMEKGAA